MGPIKNFIYLDEYKMYSLSSQIFEGITDYIIDHEYSKTTDQESQRGPIASGRILADLITKGVEKHAKRSLLDYAYTLFEKHLIDQERVLDIAAQSVSSALPRINGFSFVRVKGRAILNDIRSLTSTITQFNEVGVALTAVTTQSDRQQTEEAAEAALRSATDRNEKARIRENAKLLSDIKALAKKAGLHQDDTFLSALSFLLGYGFKDQFEIQIPLNNCLFSGNLKRDCLREPEDLLVKKYSRQTEKEFVIFGMVAQTNNEPPIPSESPANGHMKEAIMALVSHITNIESTFSGRLPNETILDPIAVYTEV